MEEIEDIINPEQAEQFLTNHHKEITFIRCAGSGTYIQFNDAILTITMGDNFCMEYQLTKREQA